eukprot:4238046-Pleurochrysis_carterae.AAC.3
MPQGQGNPCLDRSGIALGVSCWIRIGARPRQPGDFESTRKTAAPHRGAPRAETQVSLGAETQRKLEAFQKT